MLTPNMEERASPLRARPILSLRPMVVVVVVGKEEKVLGWQGGGLCCCCCWIMGTAGRQLTQQGVGKASTARGDTGNIRGRLEDSEDE